LLRFKLSTIISQIYSDVGLKVGSMKVWNALCAVSSNVCCFPSRLLHTFFKTILTSYYVSFLLKRLWIWQSQDLLTKLLRALECSLRLKSQFAVWQRNAASALKIRPKNKNLNVLFVRSSKSTLRNSWDFPCSNLRSEFLVSGFCPPSGILNTRKHNVSVTGSVSVLRCLVFRIPDDGQNPQTQEFWVLYTIARTL
jgi:hypothetical protein